MLYSFVLGSGEKVLRWCQGKVIQVLPEKVKPTVVVRWDPMPDVKGKEDLSDETQQVLPPRKWNKDVEGAWRMDFNVRFVENTEDYEGVCGVQSDLNNDGKDDSSESESCTDLSDGEESDSESVLIEDKIILRRCFFTKWAYRSCYYINAVMGGG